MRSPLSMPTLAGLLILTACSPGQGGRRGAGNLCLTNLDAIMREFRPWKLSAYSYPYSFDSLPKTIRPGIFVCPSSGYIAGSMTNVDEWTDYIYLSFRGPEDMLLDTATIICPPENHGGKYGHVVWGDGGRAIRLKADQVRALIKEPWCMPTQARHNIGGDDALQFGEYLRTNTTLHVPPRFRSTYASWHN